MTWPTSVPILVFLGLSVLELGSMYATDRRQTDFRHKHRLMTPPIKGGHNSKYKQMHIITNLFPTMEVQKLSNPFKFEKVIDKCLQRDVSQKHRLMPPPPYVVEA